MLRGTSYEVIPEKVEPDEDAEPVILDTNFFKLNFKSPKVGCPPTTVRLGPSDLIPSWNMAPHGGEVYTFCKGKKCDDECELNIGDLMILQLEPQAHGSAMESFNEQFT